MALGRNRIVNLYGGTTQQSLTVDPRDYSALNFTRLVLGVVLAVNPSDTNVNRSAFQRADRRGYLHTCSVLVVEDGRSSYLVLDNVIITPDMHCGIDDYHENLPRGCSSVVTGQNWNNQINNINPYDLDGDWCIVGFLGGSLDNPFVVRWWPHPKNPYDAATSGNANPSDTTAPSYLSQEGRSFHRVNGVEFVVTKTGNVYLSTYLANSSLSFGTPLSPVDGRFPRSLNNDEGGSIKTWIKPSQTLELDWNAPTNGVGILDESDAELPQTNPANVGSPPDKENTYILLEKNRVRIEVPEQFELLSNKSILLNSEEDTTLTVGTDLTLDVSGNLESSVGGSASLDITGSLDLTISTNLGVTVTGQADINSTGPMTIGSSSTLDVTGTTSLSLTGGSVSLSGGTVSIAGTLGGSSGTPGSIGVTSTGVNLGTGTLGGVVGGTPFTNAFTAFAANMAAAAATATVEAAYATAVTTAVATLVANLAAAVSTTTRTG
jgi:hypothetical protein